MQRYQVNVPFLVTLLIGAVLIVVLGGGLWYWQDQRNAGTLLTLAEEAKAEGNEYDYAWNLYRYVRKRPEAVQVEEKMAMAFADIAEDMTIEPKKQQNARALLEAAVRNQRDNTKLRRRLIDLYLKYGEMGSDGSVKQASEHLEKMVNDDPQNTELRTMLSECYMRLQQDARGIEFCSKSIGYDPKANAFDQADAPTPDAVGVYSNLATMLTRSKDDPAKPTAVLEKAIEVNPKEADAYVARARHRLFSRDKDEEGAVEDLEKALELDPDHLQAILVRSSLYTQDQQYEEATKLIEHGIQANPSAAMLYHTRAELALFQGGAADALEWYQKGAENTTGGAKNHFKIFLAQTLIDTGKRAEAEKIIAQLREEPYFPTPMLRYLEGLVMISQDNWYEAAKVFEEVRPELARNRQFNIRLNMQLALCYLRLEQWNDVLTASGRVLQIAPGHSMAEDLMRLARNKVGTSDISDESSSSDINSLVKTTMSLPADEQDWDMVLRKADELADELIENEKISPAGKQLLKAEILIRAKRYKEGANLVRQAIKAEPENIDTWRLACRLTAADPDGGAVKALRMLDEVVKKFDDRTILRLDRADMYMMLNDEDMIQHVISVSEGTEDWPVKDQVALWKGLATRLEAVRAMEQLNEARAKIAELAPNELANLVDMFEAARLQHDDARMKQAQDTILKVVGGKNDVYWLYTEAHRLMSQFERDLVGKDAVEEAKVHINRALEQRPEWHVLHQTLAEIAVAERDPDAALKHLDEASDLGPPTTRSLLQHVTLLMQRGRYDDALKQIERANPTYRLRLMGRQYAEALLRANYTGERDKRWEEAVPTAKEVVALAPDNGSLQLWMGRFLLAAADSSRLAESTREQARTDAGNAFQRACELMPKSPQVWSAYLGYLQITGQSEKAQQTVREVQLQLDEDQQLLVLAAGYQVLGRWVDAENVFRQALDENPDSLIVKQRMASFYISGSYRLNDQIEKATPLINDILRAAEEKPELANNESVMWARRTTAKLLAQTGDYQKSLDAARLLRSNVVNGDLILEDKLLLAKLLAARPEPVSRVRAVKMFEEVAALQPLAPPDGLVLGQLYYATGNWEAAQRQMREVISSNRDFVAARDAYTRMLLAHDEGRDLGDAARQLKELLELAPASPSTLELLVRVSSKLGQEKNVVPALQKLLKLPAVRNDPNVLVRIAKLLADLDYEDNAEKLFEVASKMNPANKMDLADFVANHRDLDRGLDILDEARSEVSDQIAMQYASAILIAAGDKATEEQFDRVESWLTRALREDPESIKLVLQKAEILGARKQYSESVDIYRDLLKRDDLTGFNRAVVLNNLAFMLASSTSDAPSNKEAMEYVNEAAQILGPRSDILDTRGVVHMALGNSDEAVSDLEYAVTDQPTASKYFHLCRAYLLARQNQKAVGAWRKAVELGLSESDVGTVEREVYREVEKRIKQLAPDAVASNRAA